MYSFFDHGHLYMKFSLIGRKLKIWSTDVDGCCLGLVVESLLNYQFVYIRKCMTADLECHFKQNWFGILYVHEGNVLQVLVMRMYCDSKLVFF